MTRGGEEGLTTKELGCLFHAHKMLGEIRVLLMKAGRADIAIKTFGVRDEIGALIEADIATKSPRPSEGEG